MRASHPPVVDRDGAIPVSTSETSGRSLLYVPIVHTEQDLGSFAEEARRRLQGSLGTEGAANRAASITEWWQELSEHVRGLPLPWERVRLYQDGLPVCNHELAIVTELAHKGHANHTLLLSLVQRGATLMGTEDARLIVAEYHRVQKLVIAARSGGAEIAALIADGDALLAARDQAVAARIDATLLNGETGILFMGLSHRVDELLRGKMDVRPVGFRLPPGSETWRKGKGQ